MAVRTAESVGSRVRALRESMGLSLRDLSQRAGVSAPMLSQVERGETSPTLTVAGRIASGLGLSLSQLLRLDEEPLVAVVRAGRGRTTRREGHRYTELTPGLPGQPTLVSVHALAGGSRTSGPPLHSPGSRETAVVQRGSVVLVIAGDRYELQEGDAVTFDADLQHHFENPGSREAEFVSVVTAPARGG
ncbi:MAG TPA: XRE family transcriptional regulator [Actinomycetota bacterium]|nr:XRE family transcriptional regulator [Actinomycetota bacterium]